VLKLANSAQAMMFCAAEEVLSANLLSPHTDKALGWRIEDEYNGAEFRLLARRPAPHQFWR
jgi:hypothetical protein